MQLHECRWQGGEGLYHEHRPCRKALLAHLLPLHHQQLHWPAQHECDEMCLQLCCSIQASPCAFQLGGPHKSACWWSPIVLHMLRSRIWCSHTQLMSRQKAGNVGLLKNRVLCSDRQALWPATNGAIHQGNSNGLASGIKTAQAVTDCCHTGLAGTHLHSVVLPRPQVVFEQPRGVLPKGAARLTFAAVSIMGVL